MTPRRFLPYKNMQTARLGLLLGTARVIAWIGMLLIIAGIAYAIAGVFFHFARGAAGTNPMVAVATALGLIAYGLLTLGGSGILAALVGIEDSQRRRAERDAI
ncbi:MAG: hypothetical protein ABI132_09400 [Rhodanobacteraceae bacterium]